MPDDLRTKTASALAAIGLSVVARFALTAGFSAFCYFVIGNAAIMGGDIATFHLVNSIFVAWAALLFLTTLQRRAWLTFVTGLAIIHAQRVVASMPIYTVQLAPLLFTDLIFVGLVLQPMSVRWSNGN